MNYYTSFLHAYLENELSGLSIEYEEKNDGNGLKTIIPSNKITELFTNYEEEPFLGKVYFELIKDSVKQERIFTRLDEFLFELGQLNGLKNCENKYQRNLNNAEHSHWLGRFACDTTTSSLEIGDFSTIASSCSSSLSPASGTPIKENGNCFKKTKRDVPSPSTATATDTATDTDTATATDKASVKKEIPRIKKKISVKKVTIQQRNALKKWLHDNIETPYPNKNEKKKMCHTLGLTNTQITNWFINARRRYIFPVLEKCIKNDKNDNQ